MKRSSDIQWHPAFVEAIQLELEDYKDSLEFIPEFQLTTGPLRIDCVVVKKARDIVIGKNIAKTFREVNLLEYKSPGDYASVGDFYKVYGYACLYASLEKVPVTGLTISFIGSRRPRDLFDHFRTQRGYKVEEACPGIYTVKGDILPIQVIDNRLLPEGENSWLRDLRSNLGPQDVRRLLDGIRRQGKAAKVKAYLDAIARANKDSVREAIKMGSTSLTFDEILEEAGLVAKWEERNSLKIARNMVARGHSIEEIAASTELDPEKVKKLYQEYGD